MFATTTSGGSFFLFSPPSATWASPPTIWYSFDILSPPCSSMTTSGGSFILFSPSSSMGGGAAMEYATWASPPTIWYSFDILSPPCSSAVPICPKNSGGLFLVIIIPPLAKRFFFKSDSWMRPCSLLTLLNFPCCAT